jgi:hypothetical protein
MAAYPRKTGTELDRIDEEDETTDVDYGGWSSSTVVASAS